MLTSGIVHSGSLVSSKMLSHWFVPVLQESSVQMSASLQVGGVPALQIPAPSQVSAPLQNAPSVQDEPDAS